jgi:hypothetical protein
MNISMLRTRWAAIGAAVAVTLGAGGLGITYATSPAGAAAYVPITPCRLADTRPAPDNVGPRNTPIVAGSSLTVLAHGENGNCRAATGNAIPATATGLQLNVTGIGATTPTFVTVWPTGAAQPVTSNLNLVPGAPPTPNAVTTGLSLDGKFDIANGIGSVNVIVDVVGYYTDHNHDDRYLPAITVLSYSGSNTEASPVGTYELIRTVGNVTKASADTTLQLDWTAHHQYVGTDNSDFCQYQLRIDGLANDGDSGTGFQLDQEGTVASYSANSPISASAMFQGLAVGSHAVQIYVRGSATSCILNRGNFNQQVVVTEFRPAAGSTLASTASFGDSDASGGGL